MTFAHTIKHLVLAALASASLSALAQSTPAGTPGSSVPDAHASAPRPAAESHFIVTRLDTRKCAYPLCGGYFVKAVNRTVTRCADGVTRPECHAVELDTRSLGWSEEQRTAFEAGFAKGQALVRGVLEPQPRGQATGDVLRISQAWQGQGGARPLGTFFRARSTGIVCIQAPCPSFELQALNRPPKPVTVDSLDFSQTGATADEIAAAGPLLEQGEVLAAGVVLPFQAGGLNGPVFGKKLLASEFYLPARP